MNDTSAKKQIKAKGFPVRRPAGSQRDGWAGVFRAGTFYRRTTSVFGRTKNKYEDAKRGPPLKHRRTDDCPACGMAVCTKPGVPATKGR